MDPWKLLLSALGLAVFLEGLPYFISPHGVRRLLHQLDRLDDANLRVLGFAMMAIGLTLAWIALVEFEPWSCGSATPASFVRCSSYGGHHPSRTTWRADEIGT